MKDNTYIEISYGDAIVAAHDDAVTFIAEVYGDDTQGLDEAIENITNVAIDLINQEV